MKKLQAYLTVKDCFKVEGNNRMWYQEAIMKQIARGFSYNSETICCPLEDMVSGRLLDFAKAHTPKPKGRGWAIN